MRSVLSPVLAWCLLAATAAAEADDAPMAKEKPAPVSAPGGEEVSEPERIIRLQELVKRDKEALAQAREEAAKIDKEVEKSGKLYTSLEKQLASASKDLAELKKSGTPAQVKEKQDEVASLDKRFKLAKEQLDLVVKQRKTLTETIDSLGAKISKDEAALDELVKGAKPKSEPEPSAPTKEGVEKTGAPKKEEPPKPENKELTKARAEAKTKKETAEAAKLEAESINERMQLLRQNIDAERKLLGLAREKADIAYARQSQLQQDLRKKQEAGAKKEEVDALWKAQSDADQQAQDARKEVRERTSRLNDLQAELSVLQSEQIIALQEAEQKSLEAQAAEKQLARLENPFTPRNVLQWLINHGPKLAAILLGMIALLIVGRVAERHLIAVMVNRQRSSLNRQERENRAQTLVGVMHNALRLVVFAGGVIMILEECNVPIVPLMGGAAVVGLAFAFGAQNLMKDYFNGFMILLEHQYGVNDIISVGSVTGVVEQISLRMTALRDLEGTIHFIPHGTIAVVSNLTHGWSRALFDIGVAYKEDVDQVIRVLLDLGRELREDPSFSDLILDNPEMLGVDAFADSAVMIKFFIKTKPLKQFVVRREMLRRIKNRFDELGIEIPFPHRTVYHRHEGNGAAEHESVSEHADAR